MQGLKPQWTPGQSTQGSYVIGWDGVGYAADNYNRDPRRLEMLLDRGLTRFRQTPPQPVTIPESYKAASKPPAPPEGVSIIRVFTRVRPLPEGEPEQFTWLGREHMWIYPSEVREMLANTKVGAAAVAMPRTLVARLVLFHIIDNTRGQVLPWRPQDVTKADFSMRATGETGELRTFSFVGDFAKRGTTGFFTDRGHEGHIDGEFSVDMKTNEILKFRAYCEAQAWAEAPHDRPGNPPKGRYPLVIAMIEADDELATCAPPEASFTGDYYRNVQLSLR